MNDSAGQMTLVATLQANGVTDSRVLGAFQAVSRKAYVPHCSAESAFLDQAIWIPHMQVTSQPSLIGIILQSLRLQGSETVLEVGSGYGYQAALLSHLVHSVTTVERWPDLALICRARLAMQQVRNVRVICGDGTTGISTRDKFDAIIVAAAYPSVPAPLAELLKTDGQLVQPIGNGTDDQVTLFKKSAEGGLRAVEIITDARFVPLIGLNAFGTAPDLV